MTSRDISTYKTDIKIKTLPYLALSLIDLFIYGIKYVDHIRVSMSGQTKCAINERAFIKRHWYFHIWLAILSIFSNERDSQPYICMLYENVCHLPDEIYLKEPLLFPKVILLCHKMTIDHRYHQSSRVWRQSRENHVINQIYTLTQL